ILLLLPIVYLLYSPNDCNALYFSFLGVLSPIVMSLNIAYLIASSTSSNSCLGSSFVLCQIYLYISCLNRGHSSYTIKNSSFFINFAISSTPSIIFLFALCAFNPSFLNLYTYSGLALSQ